MTGLKDIIIKLRMEFDNKGLAKSTQSALLEMRKIADNSKIALQKTIEETEANYAKSMRRMAEDTARIDNNALSDIFTRAADAAKMFDERVSEIERDGNIDSITAKLYSLEKSLNSTARSVLGLKSDFDALTQAKQNEEFFVQKYGSIENAKKYVADLKSQAKALWESSELKTDEGFKINIQLEPEARERMQSLLATIEELRTKLKELREARAEFEQSAEKGTPAWKQEMENLNQQITETTSKLGRLSKEFYSVARTGGYGNIIKNEDIMRNFSGITQYTEMMREANSLSFLLREIAQAGSDTNSVMSNLANAVQRFDTATEHIYQMNEELNKTNEELNETDSKTNNVTANFSNMRNVVWSVSRLLGNFYTIVLDITRAVRRIVDMYKKLWSVVKKVIDAMKSFRLGIKGAANEHAKSFKHMLKDIIRYSLGIRSLFMLFRRLRRYIKEAFEEMAKQIPEVNAVLTNLKSLLNMLKATLATAFEPILTAVAPALQTLINLLAKVMTYIGMFMAALTGRGYVYGAESVATSLEKTSKSAKKTAKSVKQVGDAVKHTNKQLQGFDELNNLATDTSGESPLAKFVKIDVPEWIKNLADKLKQLWNDILGPIKDAWAKVGDYVVNAWKNAFNSVKKLLGNIIKDFVKAWKSGLGEAISKEFFLIVGDIGRIIGNLADAVRRAWDYNNNGYKIWVAILGVIHAVLEGIHKITDDMANWVKSLNLAPLFEAFGKWIESLIPITKLLMSVLYDIWNNALKPILTWTFDGENSGLARLLDIFTRFNDVLKKSKIRNDLNTIWKALGRFGKTVGEGLLLFMERMSNRMSDWLNSKEFTKLCDKIADFLDSIEPEDIARDLERVFGIIKNIALAVFDLIKLVWKNKDKILDLLEYASEHLITILKLIVGFKLAIDFARLIANIYLTVEAFKKLGGIVEILNGIKGAFAALTGVAGGLAVSIGLMFAAFYTEYKSVESEFEKLTTNLDTYNRLNQEIQQNMEERSKTLEDFDATSAVVHQLVEELDELQSNTELTVEQQIRQRDIVDELNELIPNLNLAIDDQTGKTNLSTEAILANVDALLEQARVEAVREDLVQIAKDQYEAEKNLYKQKQDLSKAEEEYQKALAEYREEEKKYAEWGGYATPDASRWQGAKKAVDALKESIAQSEKTISDLKKEYDTTVEYVKEYTKKSEEASEKQQKVNEKIKGTSDAIKGNGDVIVHSTEKVTEATDKLAGSAENVDKTTDSLTEFVSVSGDVNKISFDKFSTSMDKFNDTLNTFNDNYESVDFENFLKQISEFEQQLPTSLPETDEWINYGTDIPEGIKTGVESNSPIANTAMTNLGKGMVTAFHDSALQFGSPSKRMIEFGKDIVLGVNEGITENQDSTVKAFNDYVSAILSSCSSLRTTMLTIFRGLANDLGIILTNIGKAFATTFEDIADSISGFKDGTNDFTKSISTSYHIDIPKLAQGAVIPPNNEFLAVLGDQKRGTNIEAPLDTIVQAFNMANQGGNEQELALLQEQNELLRQLLQKEFGISQTDLFKSVVNQNKIYKRSTGGISAFT